MRESRQVKQRESEIHELKSEKRDSVGDIVRPVHTEYFFGIATTWFLLDLHSWAASTRDNLRARVNERAARAAVAVRGRTG